MYNFRRPVDEYNAEADAKSALHKQERLNEHETMQDDIYRKQYDELHPPYKARPLWLRLLLWGIVILLTYIASQIL